MKMSAKEILIMWLKTKIGQTIHYYNIEDEVKSFGIAYYNIVHNASTYGREFRKLKNIVEDMEITEIKTDSNIGAWKISWRN